MGRKRTQANQERRGDLRAAPPAAADDPVELLVARARRLLRRGDDRRGLVLLREACLLDEWRARPFTLLGVLLARLGRLAEARQALNQARWLRARAGEDARAAVTARLAASLLEAA